MSNPNFGQLPEINRRIIANALKKKTKQAPVSAEQKPAIEESKPIVEDKLASRRRGRPPKNLQVNQS